MRSLKAKVVLGQKAAKISVPLDRQTLHLEIEYKKSFLKPRRLDKCQAISLNSCQGHQKGKLLQEVLKKKKKLEGLHSMFYNKEKPYKVAGILQVSFLLLVGVPRKNIYKQEKPTTSLLNSLKLVKRRQLIMVVPSRPKRPKIKALLLSRKVLQSRR